MEAWKRLGRSIGSHMPAIVVLCVAAGVLFPRALAPLGPAVPALFAFMTFQGSLDNTLRQVVGVLRDPLPLIAIQMCIRDRVADLGMHGICEVEGR